MIAHRTEPQATLVLLASLLLCGCSMALLSSVTPGTDLRSFKTFYVVQSDADTREVHKVIQMELLFLRRIVRTGPRSAIPTDVDVLVTYHDAWVRDITWYMVDLVIQFRDPPTNVLLASTQSRRASAVRATPELMVREALESVLE